LLTLELRYARPRAAGRFVFSKILGGTSEATWDPRGRVCQNGTVRPPRWGGKKALKRTVASADCVRAPWCFRAIRSSACERPGGRWGITETAGERGDEDAAGVELSRHPGNGFVRLHQTRDDERRMANANGKIRTCRLKALGGRAGRGVAGSV